MGSGQGGPGGGWGEEMGQLSPPPHRWVAYEGPNYSGEQYILEKGVYRNCEDWGATDCHIGSAQPILQVRGHPLLMGPPPGQWVPRSDTHQPRSVCFQVREHNLHFVSKVRGGGWGGGHSPLWGGGGALPPHSASLPPPQILLFSEPDFLGDHVSFEDDQEALPEAFIPRSCRVRGGRWGVLGPCGMGTGQRVGRGGAVGHGRDGCLS